MKRVGRRACAAIKLLASAGCLVTAALLIWGCLGIYASGDVPAFTYPKIKAAAAPALYAFAAFAVLWAAGALLRPNGSEKPPRAAAARGIKPTTPGAGAKTLRAILFALCAACLIAGVALGGCKSVYDKARAICMECIGLG